MGNVAGKQELGPQGETSSSGLPLGWGDLETVIGLCLSFLGCNMKTRAAAAPEFLTGSD